MGQGAKSIAHSAKRIAFHLVSLVHRDSRKSNSPGVKEA